MPKKAQLHIGFDAKRLFNNKRGLATYARTLLLSLRQNFPNIHIYLYTPKIRSPYKLTEFKEDPGFIIRTYDGPFSWYWRSKGIVKQLEQDHIELFHGLSSELPRGIHKTKIKSVVTIHDLLWKKHTGDYSIADRFILDSKLKNAIKYADKVISVSDHTRSILKQHVNISKPKIKSIQQIAGPEFHSDSDEHTGFETTEKYILAFADKKGRKNLDLLIEAMSVLKFKTVKLVLIGGRGERYEHAKNVIAVPHVSYHDLIKYYKNALCCAYPSSNEGFGLPILESLMSQIPVIVMDKPPMNQFVHQLVKTFPTNVTPKMLAQIIENVIESKRADEPFFAQTSIEDYARQYMDLYLSVLGY